MTSKRAAVVATLLAVAASVVAALLSRVELALALQGIALMGVVGWLVLWSRSVSGKLLQVTRSLGELHQHHEQILQQHYEQFLQRVREQQRQVLQQAQEHQKKILHQVRRGEQARRDEFERLGDALAEQTNQMEESLRLQRRIRTELLQANATVQRTPSLTVELSRLFDRLVDHDQRMPELGGWALSAATTIWLVERVVADPRISTIVECGSGSSTVWMAAALERRGGDGHVVALESGEEYADMTCSELARLGLAHRANVHHTPLVPTPLDGRDEQSWFDIADVELPEAIDLLLIDGPVGASGPYARYPAIPILSRLLTSDAVVVLDDATRPEEAEIADLWCSEIHHGRRLRPVRTVDRSSVFEVADDS